MTPAPSLSRSPIPKAGHRLSYRARRGQPTRQQDKPVDGPSGPWPAHRSRH